MDKLSFKIPPSLKALPALAKHINSFYHYHQLDKSEKLILAVEELVANIIAYGRKSETDALDIQFFLTYEKTAIFVEIIDNGIAFNPLTYKVQDLSTSLEERKVGGLGIYLSQKNVDKISYQRKGSHNHLYIKIIISGEQIKKVM